MSRLSSLTFYNCIRHQDKWFADRLTKSPKMVYFFLKIGSDNSIHFPKLGYNWFSDEAWNWKLKSEIEIRKLKLEIEIESWKLNLKSELEIIRIFKLRQGASINKSVGQSVCPPVKKNFTAWKRPFWANLRKWKLLRNMIWL